MYLDVLKLRIYLRRRDDDPTPGEKWIGHVLQAIRNMTSTVERQDVPLGDAGTAEDMLRQERGRNRSLEPGTAGSG